MLFQFLGQIAERNGATITFTPMYLFQSINYENRASFSQEIHQIFRGF
jgi:hypothetical protein